MSSKSSESSATPAAAGANGNDNKTVEIRGTIRTVAVSPRTATTVGGYRVALGWQAEMIPGTVDGAGRVIVYHWNLSDEEATTLASLGTGAKASARVIPVGPAVPSGDGTRAYQNVALVELTEVRQGIQINGYIPLPCRSVKPDAAKAPANVDAHPDE